MNAEAAYIPPTLRDQRAREGGLWRVDKCPFCRKRHTHGAGGIDDDPRKLLGWRVPHCEGGSALGYYLVPINPSTVPTSNRDAVGRGSK